MRLPHPLEAHACARPTHPALSIGDAALDYASLRAAVARRAGGLAARGVGRGHIVALTGGVDPDWVVTFHAVGWLGAAAAPLNPRATPDEHRRALAAVSPDHVLSTRAPDGDPLPAADGALDDVRLVVATSGSTGAPRAVHLTLGQILFSAFGSALRLGHDPADRWLGCLPPHHVGGASVLLRCLTYGTTAEVALPFDAATVAARLDGGAVTQVSLTPPLLAQVLDARPARPFPPALRVVLVGGGPLDPALHARARALGVPVAPTWGLTETASQVCTAAPGEGGPDVGAPLPFARVQVGDAGRLVVEGPVAPGGRVVTGDRGAVRPDGRVVVHGRADGLIISGGVNLDPQEIAAALEAHPAVREAAVVGLPDRRWGSRPAALIVARAPVGEAALRAHVRARLTGYKVPDCIVFSDTMPRTPLGKIDASAVRQQLQAAQTVAERVGHRQLAEVGEVDERVHQPDGDPQPPVLAHDGVGEGDRAIGRALDGEADDQAVALPGRRLVVGLGVHQRHAEPVAVEDRGHLTEGGGQHLLEADVGVLERTPEEHDPRAIHLVEAGGDAVFEGHGPLPEDAR